VTNPIDKAKGIGQSAAEGAAIGTSILPGIGTALGAGIGAVASFGKEIGKFFSAPNSKQLNAKVKKDADLVTRNVSSISDVDSELKRVTATRATLLAKKKMGAGYSRATLDSLKKAETTLKTERAKRAQEAMRGGVMDDGRGIVVKGEGMTPMSPAPPVILQTQPVPQDPQKQEGDASSLAIAAAVVAAIL
jgi:hypothetical protein